jgi:DNA-directed RNA polymerase subunit RPC12/RpoP
MNEFDPIPFPRETEEKEEKEHSGIKQGETIRCKMCGVEIYKARVDIPYGAPLKSEYLELMDGKPVPFGAQMACPNCWVMFRSISTKTRQTI